MRKFISHSLALAAGLTLSACGTKTSESQTKITNGHEVKESIYPSVVKIHAMGGGGTCTGTFVNDYQLITAAHCLDGMSEDSAYIFVMQFDEDGQESIATQADSFQLNPLYDASLNLSPYDLAVINFPRHATKAVSKIASSAAKVGSWVQMAGYGDNENFYGEDGAVTGSGAGVKRIGTNKLLGYDREMLRVEGVPGDTEGLNHGVQSCSGAGDSGGPLFYNSTTLIGINFGGGLIRDTSGGVEKISCLSLYVDLNLEGNKTFLDSALSYLD